MAKAKIKQVVIPKFSSEAKEASWWDAHRSEVEVEVRAKLKNPARRISTDINERASRMTPGKLRRADSETRKIAEAIQP
jgi:hypothetical protein